MRPRGFTIVEVIVAIALLSIGLVATLPMLSFAVKANIDSKFRGIALYLADQQVEKIRSWPSYTTVRDPADVNHVLVWGIERGNPAFYDGVEGHDWSCAGSTTSCKEWNLPVGRYKSDFTSAQSWMARFNRRTYFVRNGWDGTYHCDGVTFKPNPSSQKEFDEGWVYSYEGTTFLGYDDMPNNRPSLNEGSRRYWPQVNYYQTENTSDPCYQRYRGPDFVLVRVEVDWSDIFARNIRNKVVRNLFIPAF